MKNLKLVVVTVCNRKKTRRTIRYDYRSLPHVTSSSNQARLHAPPVERRCATWSFYRQGERVATVRMATTVAMTGTGLHSVGSMENLSRIDSLLRRAWPAEICCEGKAEEHRRVVMTDGITPHEIAKGESVKSVVVWYYMHPEDNDEFDADFLISDSDRNWILQQDCLAKKEQKRGTLINKNQIVTAIDQAVTRSITRQIPNLAAERDKAALDAVRAFKGLTDTERRVVEHRIDRKPFVEIGRLLNITRQGAEQALKRVEKKMGTSFRCGTYRQNMHTENENRERSRRAPASRYEDTDSDAQEPDEDGTDESTS